MNASVRVVMFDVGDTLIRASDLVLFPHVLEALNAISTFHAQASDSLHRCIVSDFPADLPVPPAKLADTLQQFLALLPQDLVRVFEPARRLVTLSAHAGVSKPDPKVFLEAIERLGVQATLDECLFITEKRDHILRCRDLGMKTLQFGGHVAPAPVGTDFTDWADGPLLIARAIAPAGGDPGNEQAAIRTRLMAAHPDLEDVSLQPGRAEGQYRWEGRSLTVLDSPDLGVLRGVHVPLPVSGSLSLDGRGRVLDIERADPDPDEIAEAEHQVKAGSLGGTHEITIDAQGHRIYRRSRFI